LKRTTPHGIITVAAKVGTGTVFGKRYGEITGFEVDMLVLNQETFNIINY
jgi:hypothetical protein